jgi:phosphoenolpyruvate---glycerone phosphotransferase subunit DhaM
MVGIVVVSHSQKLAEGVVEVSRMMASNARIVAAGGLDDGSTGTSFAKISRAIDAVYSEDGVAVLMDMGSAVMTTEMVIESMEDRRIRMFDCPLVEGAVVAALEAVMGSPLEVIEAKASEARLTKKIME